MYSDIVSTGTPLIFDSTCFANDRRRFIMSVSNCSAKDYEQNSWVSFPIAVVAPIFLGKKKKTKKERKKKKVKRKTKKREREDKDEEANNVENR